MSIAEQRDLLILALKDLKRAALPYCWEMPEFQAAHDLLKEIEAHQQRSRAFDPTYKPTKDWDQIARELPNSQYAQEQAQNLREWRTRQTTRPSAA